MSPGPSDLKKSFEIVSNLVERFERNIEAYRDQQVFVGATNYTCLLFLNKAGKKQCHFVKVDDLSAWRNTDEATEGKIPTSRITGAGWNFTAGNGVELFERLSKMPTKLEDVAHIFVGTQTSADNIFVLNECQRVRPSGPRSICC